MTQYHLPDLGYGYDSLEPVYSKELLQLHHDAHHAAYVKGANQALEKLSEARSRKDYASLNQLQKDLAFHLSGHVLHSLFWRNLTPDGGDAPKGALAAAIQQSFGGENAFREHFSSAATSIQGSGWSALSWEPLSQSLIVEQVWDHQGNVGRGTLPLLVLDMWEHAYYLQYKNRKAEWVKSYWQIVNWRDVEERFNSVKSADLRLAA